MNLGYGNCCMQVDGRAILGRHGRGSKRSQNAPTFRSVHQSCARNRFMYQKYVIIITVHVCGEHEVPSCCGVRILSSAWGRVLHGWASDENRTSHKHAKQLLMHPQRCGAQNCNALGAMLAFAVGACTTYSRRPHPVRDLQPPHTKFVEAIPDSEPATY